MPSYPSDNESLYPDDGEFSVVILDELKPRDADDFMVKFSEFDSAEDVAIPVEKKGYIYYVYGADGDSWTREEWNNRKEES